MGDICKNCRRKKNHRKVNYGELTATGGEIKIPDCFIEKYDDEIDDCICINYDYKETNNK